MFDRLREWIRAWLGVRVERRELPVDDFVRTYEDITVDNVIATIANKLAMLTIADSTLQVTDAAGRETLTPRAQLIADRVGSLWDGEATWITAQAFGKGGMVLAPMVTPRRQLHVGAVDQSRAVVLERDGDTPTNVALLAEQVTLNDRRYSLIANYELTDMGGATGQIIRYRAVDQGGAPVGLQTIPQWAGITPEVRISGTDRLLLAFLLCPRDNRRTDKDAGVPITYGSDRLVEELVEHANIYRREYKLTRPMLGLDSTLWASSGEVMNIRNIRRTVQDSDDPFVPMDAPALSEKAVWQYYAPAIRQEAMEARLQSLCRRLEKSCGLSQGILTERQTLNYANRDEVRAAQYDTFAVVRAMRTRWERAMDDLAYGLDVISERAGLTPAGGMGQYQLVFDWDNSLIESTAETFEQYLELESRGALSKAELRQWVRGGSLEEAQQAVDEMGDAAGDGADPALMAAMRGAGED
ncbi:MAG: hypothetical protein IJJ45_01750 [Clostridia bacterium]|nr:hypothetical protein [Clostridia bacterium]